MIKGECLDPACDRIHLKHARTKPARVVIDVDKGHPGTMEQCNTASNKSEEGCILTETQKERQQYENGSGGPPRAPSGWNNAGWRR